LVENLRKIHMPQVINYQTRAEIAGRFHVKKYGENQTTLADEYRICRRTVQVIIASYTDKLEEAIAAAERYYQTHPRPTQPLARSGNAEWQEQNMSHSQLGEPLQHLGAGVILVGISLGL